MGNSKPLEPLKERFLQKCFSIIEEGVEEGTFRMKDVARYLGISSQVASKLVNPSDPRTLTAFELFRVSVMIRRPITDIISMNYYLTPEELNDSDLCQALSIIPGSMEDNDTLSQSCRALPEGCRQCVMKFLEAIGSIERTDVIKKRANRNKDP